MHMKIHSWYVTLGILGVSAAAASACTVTSTTSNPDDGGLGDASMSETDSGTDAGTTVPTPDSGTVVTEGGDGGITCEVDPNADACDSCATTKCCAAENQCQNVEATTDAGTTDCEEIFSCVQDCIAPPADSGVAAGTLADCTSTCMAGHSTLGVTDFGALSTCLVASCASQCQ
jgi:hypothetical protein